MKESLAVTVAGMVFALSCWTAIVHNAPRPPETREIEVQCDLGSYEEPLNIREESSPAPQPALANHKPTVFDHALRGPKRYAIGLVIQAVSISGGLSFAASTPPSGVLPYPVQPKLDVAWSLQGLADQEEQAGEGDYVEYGG